MILSGIDYSMSSPCICIYDTSNDTSNETIKFKNCSFFVYSNTKKHPSLSNVKITPQSVYSCQEERFDNISQWAVNALLLQGVSVAGIEGYSYGSKSNRLFDIGENGGVLKHKLWKANIKYDIYSPGAIKKSYTGKGNSNKDAMYLRLRESEQIDLGDSSDSPVSDIVDAYAIMLHTHQIHFT